MPLLPDPRQDTDFVASVEQDAALYAATRTMLNLARVEENENFTAVYERQDIQSREAWIVRKAFENEADQTVIQSFAVAGLYLDAKHGKGIASLNNISIEDTAALAQGTRILLSNGEIRERAGAIIADVAELQSFRITETKTAWEVLKDADKESTEHYEFCQENA